MNKIQNITTIPEPDDPLPEKENASDAVDLCTLFETEEDQLLHYAFSLVGRKAVAEELVQEVFLQLHAHWDEVENPKAWLYRSIRNRSYNHNRDHKKEILTDHDNEGLQSQEASTPEELLQRIEAAGCLRLLLAEIDELDREIITLKYYQNLKYAEISERVGISVSNIGYRLHHILKHLSGELLRYGIDSASPPKSFPT